MADEAFDEFEFEPEYISGNWHKVVPSRTSHPPLTASRPSMPTPRTPLPLDYQVPPPPLRPRRRYSQGQSHLFFWASIVLLAAVVLGTLAGVVVALNRQAQAQHPPQHAVMTLLVTPTSVSLGSIITVRGAHFSPNVKIGLTRDSNIPIVDTASNSIIGADKNGAFTDTVLVDATWQAGSHIIRAEDALLHKSAAFTILVSGQSASLRPSHLLISVTSLDLGSGDQATNSTKTITLTDAGGGQISWQSTSTQPWLLLSPKSGTFSSGQSVQVTVAADRSNLRPGSYNAQLIFQSNAGQVTLPVQMKATLLQPGHEPILQLTPAVLAFTAVDGSGNPPSQVVTVSNPGVLPLQWNAFVSAGNNWLSITPFSGTVNKGGSTSVLVGANTSTQLPGTYNGLVTFANQGPNPTKGSPQNVYVSLTILPQCALQVSPGNLTFTGVYLQPGPAPKVISLGVTQGCSSSLRWSASVSTNNGGHWLSINNNSGTTPSYPSIGVNVGSLTPGTYTGSVIFSSSAGTQTLSVTFIMGQPTSPILSTNPATMSFTGIIGDPNPPQQTASITNTGGGTLNWQAAVSTNFGGSWLAVTSSSGSLGASQSVQIGVSATIISGLTPNTYTGQVTISGTDSSGHTATGSPQTIPVNFIVQPACTIAAAPVALNFNGVAGQPNPSPQTATITASGTCLHALNWTASSNAAWLSASPATGSVSLPTPATTNIEISLAGLGANTYTGQMTITAVDSVTGKQVGTPQNIAVTLTVQPPCTLQAPSTASMSFSSEQGSNPNPPSQNFTIGIIGACSGSVTITPTITQSWLAVTPPSASISSGSATFTVTVTSASLGTGQASDTVSLAAVDNGMTITGSPQSVGVTVTVLAPPALSVTPVGGLTFNVITGTSSQAVTLNNTGGEPLNWTATLDSGAPSYVSLSATSGNGLGGGNNTSFNVIVDATGVPGGTNATTSVTVSAIDPITGNAVAGSPVTVPITINVAPPAMSLDTTSLSFTTTVGVNPSPQNVNLTNTGGDGLTWVAGSPSQTWLTLSIMSGSNNSGVTTPIPFNVNVNTMTSGTYMATVVITPMGNSSLSQTVTVTLTIS